MNKRTRVAVITGTRAEFGLLEPVLQAMSRRTRIESRIIVTGMHLLAKFGRTVNEVKRRWHVDATVRMQTGRDNGPAEAAAVGRGIEGIARTLDRLDCDVVLVLGDRIEAFAGAVAGAIGRRVVAHIHGGDRAPGSIDDSLRNAITRLAHVHLVASKDAARRLVRMGEPADRIHLVGAPGLDAIRQFRTSEKPATTHSRLAELIGPLADRSYAVLLLHACGRKPQVEAAVTRAAIAAIERNRLAGVAIWPNSDPGHEGVIRELKKQTDRSAWKAFKSLAHDDYLRLASQAAVLVGNSSSGIIESASLGVCAVNIGERQAGRLRCGASVIDADESVTAIAGAIKKALARPKPAPAASVYGDGRAAERIASVLARLRPNPALVQKSLSY